MQFDFERFKKLFARAYPVAKYGRNKQNGNDCGLYSYNDALNVFWLYFSEYEHFTGGMHPQLKREKIIDIIQKMDACPPPGDLARDDLLISPDVYQDLIIAHFRTEYRNCDYNICHFFSGCIRYFRFWDLIY